MSGVRRALVVVGPPGAGKSSVLVALHDALSDDGVPHAVVEVEALAWTHPPLAEEQALAQLERIRAGYEEAGVELLLCGATVTSQAYLDALRAALAAEETFVVRLEAEASTLERRIVAREPPGWSGLDGLVAAAREIAGAGLRLAGVDLVLSTEAESADGAARRIRAALPDWLG